jgi:2-polyprenyl-3-methyl-5-hydroxy-6-metoxy-1,4-benzoquinol methylase
MRCDQCGCAYLDPRPDDDVLAEAYSRYYTHQPPDVEPEPNNRLAHVRRALRNGYLNARYGYRLEPSWSVGSAIVPLLRHHRVTTERTARSVPLATAVLDVGCGNGQFVKWASRAGWQAEGVEQDGVAAAAARSAGLTVSSDSLADLSTRRAREFDAVTMDHVIEHVPDPVEFLRSARRVLRPGGTLWIATPNLDAPGHRVFGRHWLGLDPPRHLTVFTRGGLESALTRAGFTAIRRAPMSHSSTPYIRGSLAVRSGGPAIPDTGARLPVRWRWRSRLMDARASRARADGEEICLLASVE